MQIEGEFSPASVPEEGSIDVRLDAAMQALRTRLQSVSGPEVGAVTPPAGGEPLDQERSHLLGVMKAVVDVKAVGESAGGDTPPAPVLPSYATGSPAEVGSSESQSFNDNWPSLDEDGPSTPTPPPPAEVERKPAVEDPEVIKQRVRKKTIDVAWRKTQDLLTSYKSAAGRDKNSRLMDWLGQEHEVGDWNDVKDVYDIGRILWNDRVKQDELEVIKTYLTTEDYKWVLQWLHYQTKEDIDRGDIPRLLPGWSLTDEELTELGVPPGKNSYNDKPFPGEYMVLQDVVDLPWRDEIYEYTTKKLEEQEPTPSKKSRLPGWISRFGRPKPAEPSVEVQPVGPEPAVAELVAEVPNEPAPVGLSDEEREKLEGEFEGIAEKLRVLPNIDLDRIDMVNSLPYLLDVLSKSPQDPKVKEILDELNGPDFNKVTQEWAKKANERKGK